MTSAFGSAAEQEQSVRADEVAGFGGMAGERLLEGVPIEQIARLVGHTGGSTVTETVYRK